MEVNMERRRICTDEDVAEVLDGFEEEMLASIRRGKQKKETQERGRVLEFPPKLTEQELLRRQLIIDQAWERVLEQGVS
jgi:hypothetical protein